MVNFEMICLKIPKKRDMIEILSIRENQVIESLALGLTVKEIASKLCISPYTVNSHIKSAKRKTRARTLSELVRIFCISVENPKEYFEKVLSDIYRKRFI